MKVFVDPGRTGRYVLKEQRPLPLPGSEDYEPISPDETDEDRERIRKEVEAENERRGKERITFLLRVLTARQYSERADLIRARDDSGRLDTKVGTWTFYTLKAGLIGWEGPEAPKFEADRFGQPTDETIGRLAPRIRTEIANAIDDLNRLDGEEGKG